MKKKGAIIVAILVAVLAMLEILPRNHTNPPVRQEPAWNQPETRLLAKRACFDCHSNETKWPAYAIATPVSWLIQRDVNLPSGWRDLDRLPTTKCETSLSNLRFPRSQSPCPQYIPSQSRSVLDSSDTV
jgi:hypothetical protein